MRSNQSQIKSSKYKEVAIEVARRIADGEYKVGEKIKSRSSLASIFNVSPETARKGLSILADLHIVTLKHGSGVIVLSKEKAIEFLENYEATHSIAMVKEKIRDNISHHLKGLENLSHLVDEFLQQSQSISRHYPLTPYEIIVNKDTDHFGKTLDELNIWHQTGATVVAIEKDNQLLLSPSPYAIVEKGDHIFFVGDDLAYSRMKRFFNLSKGLY